MGFEFDTKDFENGFIYFPIVGGVVGSILMLPLLAVEHVPEMVMPFFIIILYLLIVGGLHIDGIGDVFDGIFSARDRDRMLVIMEDSHVGAFGVVGLILYFIGMFIGLYEVCQKDQAMLYVFLLPVLGRSFGLIGAGAGRYAKETGLGKSLIDGTKPVVSVALVMISCLVTYVIGLPVLVAFLVTLTVVLTIVFRIQKLLGGITGDVIGLLVEVSQVVFLLALSVSL